MRLCHTLTVLSLTFTIGFFYFSPIKVKGKSVSQWHTIYQNTDGYWLWSTFQKSLPCHNLWQSVQPFLQNGIFVRCFQRCTFPNVMAIFGMLFSTCYVFQSSPGFWWCCFQHGMLFYVIFNVAMLPITCPTLKSNEANIPHKTVVIPGYCYIILQELTSVCHQFCSYIQRSHVAYVQADLGNVTRNIPCCLMFTRFLATLFSTYHVDPYCGCFFSA